MAYTVIRGKNEADLAEKVEIAKQGGLLPVGSVAVAARQTGKTFYQAMDDAVAANP